MPWDQGPGLRCPGALVPGIPSKCRSLSFRFQSFITPTLIYKSSIQLSIYRLIINNNPFAAAPPHAHAPLSRIHTGPWVFFGTKPLPFLSTLPSEDSARPIDYSVSDIRVSSTPFISTQFVRDFNFLQLELFIFHNTDTFYLLPYQLFLCPL